MVIGPIKAERRTPIMDHERDGLAGADHRVDEAGEIFAMGGETVGIRPGLG